MKQNHKTKKKGFSLVESLVSLFVFSLAAILISGVFSILLKNYATAKKMQRSTESVQYTMNLMAKSLRTSDLSTTSLTGFPIKAFDYSQAKCIRYEYDSTAKKIKMASVAGMGPSSCNYDVFVPADYVDLTSGNVVSASVSAVQSEEGVKTGKISVSIEIEGEPNNVFIQSTLSLRGASVAASSGPPCESFTYTAYGPCLANNTQTRSVVSSVPAVCSGGVPRDTTQACTYGPSCTGWTYGAWGACQADNQQSRTATPLLPSPTCTGGNPIVIQSCSYVPACSSWTYNAWGTCQSNDTQTRTVASSSPFGCTGGSPILSQSCVYSDPTCSGYDDSDNCIGYCNDGAWNGWELGKDCGGPCVKTCPPPPTCTSWTYSAWGACQSDSTQTRTFVSASPAGCTGGAPVLSQTCTYVPPAGIWYSGTMTGSFCSMTDVTNAAGVLGSACTPLNSTRPNSDLCYGTDVKTCGGGEPYVCLTYTFQCL